LFVAGGMVSGKADGHGLSGSYWRGELACAGRARDHGHRLRR